MNLSSKENEVCGHREGIRTLDIIQVYDGNCRNFARPIVMGQTNVLVIMSDEHTRSVMGAYGNPLVKTPALDQLANSGVRFNNAYTPSPICISARASFATGTQVFEHRCWSSAEAYYGQHESWMHRLRAHGNDVVSIGKLHYRSGRDDGGCPAGVFMLRKGRWKYIYFAEGNPDLLFDIERDPRELSNLATDPEYQATRGEMLDTLRSILDPEQVNSNALADQAEMIKKLGGLEGIKQIVGFNYTPIG